MDPKVLADMIYKLRVFAMDAKQRRDSTDQPSELFTWRTGYYEGISAAIRIADNTLDEVLYSAQPKPKK